MRSHALVRSDPNWPSITAMLRAREADERPALEAWRGVCYSFADVARCARSVAAFLGRGGLKPGDMVIVTGEDSPEWMLAYFGARLAGAILIPLDCQLGPDRVAGIAAFTGARRVFADAPREAELAGAGPGPGGALEILSLERASPRFGEIFHGEPAAWSALPEPDPDQVAAILFTSGTTDEPKGVELTERNLLGNAQTLARLGLEDESDVMGVVLPLHHAYAFTVGTMAPFVMGARTVFPGTLKGELIRQCLSETGVTMLPAVPRLLELMAEGIERQIRGRPLPARLYARAARALGRWGRRCGIPLGRLVCAPIRRAIGQKLRFIISAGAALPAETNEFFLDLGFTVVEGYGLTETSPAIAITPRDSPRPGSVGWPIPGAEIRLGPPREDGSAEVMVRGPMVMRGYHRRPDLTREVFEGDFFKTGDLGRYDVDDYLWITGRVKEVIVLPSGKNVYPEEVERHYLRSPAIKEICVLENPERSKCLHAVIVPNEEAARSTGEALASRIQFDVETCSKDLPSHQRIAGFTLTSEPLPRTRLEKIRRGEVAKMLPALMKGQRSARALSAGEEAMVASEAGGAVLAVLADMVGRPVHAAEHIELDLNLDSLRRLEALARLESALGLEIDAERIAGVTRVLDLIAAIKEGRTGKAASFSWPEFLRREPAPPLGALVTIEPGIPTKILRAAAWLLVRAVIGFRYGLEVRGTENLPAGPCIVAPNHLSIIDAPLMFIAIPSRLRRRLCFFGARSQFRSLFRRFLVKPARVILTDQLEGARQSLGYGAEALRRGLSLCIFPEGRRSATGEVEPGRPGTGLLARELGVPVVPALIEGTGVVWSRLAAPPPRGRFVVTYGKPISPDVFRAILHEDDLGKPWDAAIQSLTVPAR
jgi:long-chain acyl-CoA synthetase